MVEDGSVKVMGILASASARLAEGEVMQLLTANDTETGEMLISMLSKQKLQNCSQPLAAWAR